MLFVLPPSCNSEEKREEKREGGLYGHRFVLRLHHGGLKAGLQESKVWFCLRSSVGKAVVSFSTT